MTIAVDLGRKATKQTNKQNNLNVTLAINKEVNDSINSIHKEIQPLDQWNSVNVELSTNTAECENKADS